MDNTSTANANKASAASSWSPTKWVAGLMGRGAPIAAATTPTEATADNSNGVDPDDDYIPITLAAASISAAAATARTTAATASSFDGTSLYDDPTTTCDWAVEECHMVGLPLKKCQRFGCIKHLHHICSIQWATKNNIPECTIATLCRTHHPGYADAAMLAASSFTTAGNNITGGVNLTSPFALPPLPPALHLL